MEELEREMARIDALLAPIAKAKVDLSNPNWMHDMVQGFRDHPPIDRVGSRAQAQAVLYELITRYAEGGDETRAHIRELFARYSSFRWAANLPGEVQTAQALRDELILLSARDQSSDTRDEILNLQAFCRQARAAGVEVEPILREVAAMSSDVDRYGMGSTRDVILNYGRE